MPAVIQIKRGTASSWTSANTVLAAGEIGFETDTKKMKVGDGSTAWTSLGYTATDGDISGVTAGTGLTGGGNSGGVTVSLDTTSAYVVPSQTGHSGKYLTTNGTASSWGTVDLSGKTDKSTLTTTGDIYYASAANTPARLGIGSTGQVLTVSGGVPTWAAASGSTFRGAMAHRDYSGQPSIPTNTITWLTWHHDSYDSSNFHTETPSATMNRFTVPLTGYYLIHAYVTLNFNYHNALGGYRILCRKNGSGTVYEREHPKHNTGYSTGAGTTGGGALTGLNGTFLLQANANDYFEIGVWQDTNGTVSAGGGGHGDSVFITYMGNV